MLRMPMPIGVTALVRLTKALDAALKESGRVGVIRTNDGGPIGELRVYAVEKTIEELIERSSLGTPEAKALRESADPALVERVMAMHRAAIGYEVGDGLSEALLEASEDMDTKGSS